MTTVLKASATGVMVLALGLFLTPSVKSGPGCGETSGCQSEPKATTAQTQTVPSANQEIVQLETLSGQLANSIVELETQLSSIGNRIEQDGLREELEIAKRMVASLRSNLVNYQVLSLNVMASSGHADGSVQDSPTSASSSPEGCNH